MGSLVRTGKGRTVSLEMDKSGRALVCHVSYFMIFYTTLLNHNLGLTEYLHNAIHNNISMDKAYMIYDMSCLFCVYRQRAFDGYQQGN